jgi:hypothetical protein
MQNGRKEQAQAIGTSFSVDKHGSGNQMWNQEIAKLSVGLCALV